MIKKSVQGFTVWMLTLSTWVTPQGAFAQYAAPHQDNAYVESSSIDHQQDSYWQNQEGHYNHACGATQHPHTYQNGCFEKQYASECCDVRGDVNGCQPECCDNCNGWILGGALLLGAAGGALVSNSHHGDHGDHGNRGPRGTSGNMGPPGPTGPAGEPPLGPDDITFTFTSVVGEGVIGTWKGVVVNPAYLQKETDDFVIDTIPTGPQSITFFAPSETPYGEWAIVLAVTSPSGLVSPVTLGQVVVTNSGDPAQQAIFNNTEEKSLYGDQATFDWIYSPFLVPGPL